MNRSATSLVFAWLVMAATPAVAGAQAECVYGQGQPCEHTSDCAGFADAPLCVDGACQMPCDDGTGQPVAKSCSLGETCVAGESPGVGERYYCKPGTFSMDLSLLDSCLYHFVEDIQPDLSSGDSCSLARNLNVLLDRDGTDGFTIYDADLCIKDFLAEKPCNTGSRSCANGQVYCDDDVECGEGLYCNQELHHCERECGVIPSRSSLQTSLDRECVAPLTSCDYLRGRCEPVDIRDAECAIDRDCPHGATCFLGQCAPRCFRSLDCPDSGWYCAADNTCKPKPSAGSEGAAFDPKQYSVQLAQREVRLDEFNDSYDIPLLIMSTVTRKQVFSDPNVVFGYRLEASYARKQDPVCLGNLTGLAPDVQKDCVISADEEFVSFDNPFGTVYAEGDPALRVRLNRGAVKGLSPGVYQATLTAIFNNGVTTSGTISFEKTSPSGEYGGRFSVYLGDAQTGLLGTMNLGMRLNVASSGSWVWDDLLRDNNIAVQRDYDDVTRGLPVVGTIHGVESAAFAQPSALTPKDNEIAVKGIYSPQLGRMHLVAVIDLTASYCRGEAGPCTPSDASDLEVKNAFERPVRRVIELLGPFDAKTRKFDGMYRETISGLVPYDVTLDGGFIVQQTSQNVAPITVGKLLPDGQPATVAFPALPSVLASVNQEIAKCAPADAARFADPAAFAQYLAQYDAAGPVLADLVSFEGRLRQALSALGPSSSQGALTLTDYFKGSIQFCDAAHTTSCINEKAAACGLALHQRALLSRWVPLDQALAQASSLPSGAPLFCKDRAGRGSDCPAGASQAPTLVTLQEHNRFYREIVNAHTFRAGEALSDAFHTLFKAQTSTPLDGASGFAHKQNNLRDALASYDAARREFLAARAASVLFNWPMEAFQTLGESWMQQMHHTLTDRMEALTQLFDLRRRVLKNSSDQDALFVDQVLQQEYLEQVYLAVLQKHWQGEQFSYAGEGPAMLEQSQALLAKVSATRNALGIHPNRVFFENSSPDTTLPNWDFFRKERVMPQVEVVRQATTDAISNMRHALEDSQSLLSRLQVEQHQLDASLDEICGAPGAASPTCDVSYDEKQLAKECQGPECLAQYQCDGPECDSVIKAFQSGANDASSLACRTDTRPFSVNIGSEQRTCMRGRVGALLQERVATELKRKQTVQKVKSLLRQVARKQAEIAEAQKDNQDVIDYLEKQDKELIGVDAGIAAAELAFALASSAAEGVNCLLIVGVATGGDCPTKAISTALAVVAIGAKYAAVPALESLKASMARAKEIKLTKSSQKKELDGLRNALDNMITDVENLIAEYEGLTQQSFNLDTQVQDAQAQAQRVAARYSETIYDVVDNLTGKDSTTVLLRNRLVEQANTGFQKLLVETYKMAEAFSHHFNASVDGQSLIDEVFKLNTVDEVAAYAEKLRDRAQTYCAREGIDCDSAQNRKVLEFSVQKELFPDLRDIVDARTGKVLTVGQQFHNLITSSAFIKRRQMPFGPVTQIEIPFSVWANDRRQESNPPKRFMLPRAECNHILVGDRSGQAGTIAVNLIGSNLSRGGNIEYQMQRGATDYLRSCSELVKPDESKVNTYTIGWSPTARPGQLDQAPEFLLRTSLLPACVNNQQLEDPSTQATASACYHYFVRDRSLAAPDWMFILPDVDEDQRWILGEGLAEDERPVIEDIKIYFRHNARAISGI